MFEGKMRGGKKTRHTRKYMRFLSRRPTQPPDIRIGFESTFKQYFDKSLESVSKSRVCWFDNVDTFSARPLESPKGFAPGKGSFSPSEMASRFHGVKI